MSRSQKVDGNVKVKKFKDNTWVTESRSQCQSQEIRRLRLGHRKSKAEKFKDYAPRPRKVAKGKEFKEYA